MLKDTKISKIQLSVIMIGFIFGESAISGLGANAGQDAWLAYLLAWLGGMVLLSIYIGIFLLYPEKSLIEILRSAFGQYLGSFLAILYIWYFIHLAGIVYRYLNEFIVAYIYPDTPFTFISIVSGILIIYIIRSGIEVLGRFNEFFVPFIVLSSILVFVLLVPLFEYKNLTPFLENGLKPVFKSSFSILAFPFGEIVVLLMIFPFLNRKKDITKLSFISLIITGLILASIIVRDLLVLGSDMYSRYVFPNIISAKVVPFLSLDTLIVINLNIGGGVKLVVCIYAAVMGIAQLFKFKDYKPFVTPVMTIVITLSLWLYDDLLELIRWDEEIYAFYAVPFQIIIPVSILVKSWVKNKFFGIK